MIKKSADLSWTVWTLASTTEQEQGGRLEPVAPVDKEQIWQLLTNAYANKELMCASIGTNVGSADVGLGDQHAYSILGVSKRPDSRAKSLFPKDCGNLGSIAL
jgi:hypothetical protein